jgi:hypothetical protein
LFLHFLSSSLAEIEKLYYIALNGSEEEKSAAAKILCGASLSRGWNIQVASLVMLESYTSAIFEVLFYQ